MILVYSCLAASIGITTPIKRTLSEGAAVDEDSYSKLQPQTIPFKSNDFIENTTDFPQIAGKTCPEIYRRNVMWPETAAGLTTKRHCPNDLKSK